MADEADGSSGERPEISLSQAAALAVVRSGLLSAGLWPDRVDPLALDQAARDLVQGLVEASALRS